MQPSEEIKKDFETRVQEVLSFAKEKEVSISAVQQIDDKGRIETVPMYKDFKKYEIEKVVAEKTSDDTN
jgi:hypothetical protein